MSAADREMAPDIVLRAEGITKIYGGTVALDNVDFTVYRGKVNVLIGENGAGKSTLMKIIAGAETATRGRLLLEGQPVHFKSPREAARAGIGMIYQELNLFPNLSVAENIFLDHEAMRRRGFLVDRRRQQEAARRLLERLEQPIDPQALVGNLRLGQQQIVEIAKALARDVRILIMDEPTSALTTAEVEILFRVIRELKEQGVSIIYISHKLEELLRIGDYVTILRDSHRVAEAPVSAIDVNWIVEQMIGRSVSETYIHQERTPGQELLRVEHLSLPRPGGGLLLDDVSFQVRAGEIVALYGLLGAGRSELLECLMGLHPEASGALWVAGQPVRGRTVGERIAEGLVLVPEDRQREGLVPTLSVAHNMVLASLRRYLSGLALSRKKELTAVRRLISDLGIKAPSPQTLIEALSGGNQQKVVVARGLLTEPRVLLLDEPTRGIDIGAKADLFRLMNRLASEGLGVLFVSSELREVMSVADRILVLARGRLTGEFRREEASEEALVAAASAGQGPVSEKEETGEWSTGGTLQTGTADSSQIATPAASASKERCDQPRPQA
ncbi:MAG: sugar ABC transporter ATP-binding protein [Thermogemmatispora sp.]|jgi:erythritol transport system ATP-binding protein|uniref:Sugar ABC transporter ATP-binding protein n=1 Tax=Thermogemmatispora aurantia TaxID=2045279 RepID=A0A5J4K961_9CHLR|nr:MULTISPECIES: sugar ABC transporter ATP-binding protein [Thermogemmatispora]MBE3567194.1 sugar ABC transporter ATP-binding protein [Thermogemmatispora sp.]GER83269.1 sugar ABC transporter ATP-binding protein [Thermogemmatispora aurantia]